MKPERRELVLATGNYHKRDELELILPGWKVLTPADLGVDFTYEERGLTYLENALGKAEALREILDARGIRHHRPILADDSGLSVTALDGAPGVFSARYGKDEFGRMLSASERNEYLLDKLRNTGEREAFFVCCLVAVFERYRFFVVQETWHGRIADRPSEGKNGFGYDPVFFVDELGRTAAELPPTEKNRHSHRGKAAQRMELLLSASA